MWESTLPASGIELLHTEPRFIPFQPSALRNLELPSSSPFVLPDLAQKGPGRDNRYELANGFAKLDAEFQQSLVLPGRDRDPRWELGAPDLIFDLQVTDLAPILAGWRRQ